MAPRDPRQLREDAAAAAAAGKYKRALEAYLELERRESADAQWPKRAAEMLRRLGKTKEAIAAYDRAADRYTSGGFLVQAIAVCKLILQLDPSHQWTQRRLAAINEQQGNASTRIGALAETNPSLKDNPAVASLRAGSTRQPPMEPDPAVSRAPTPPRTRTPQGLRGRVPTPPDLGVRIRPASSSPPAGESSPTEYAVPRTRTGDEITVVRRRTGSKPPIKLDPGAAIDKVPLRDVVPGAHQFREGGTQPGILVIPLDDDQDYDDFEVEAETSPTVIEPEPASSTKTTESFDPATLVPIVVDGGAGTGSLDVDAGELDDAEELDLDDLEEVPLPVPRLVGAGARRALALTPLFAGLPMDTLECLIEHLQLVTLLRGDVLFREGDPGDALFIISEGEVSVASEGPPRVEMARLGPGAFFGEVSLVTDQPRAATVTALGATEMIMIDRRAMAAVLARQPDALRPVLRFVRDRLVDRLVRTSPLFRPFDEAEGRALADRFRFLEIDDTAVILPAGERADGLYIVLAGQVEVRGGRVMLGPGDLIGETSLITGERVTHPVVAVGKCLALCLPAPQFRELIMTHPHVLEYVGQQVEARRKVRMI